MNNLLKSAILGSVMLATVAMWFVASWEIFNSWPIVVKSILIYGGGGCFLGGLVMAFKQHQEPIYGITWSHVAVIFGVNALFYGLRSLTTLDAFSGDILTLATGLAAPLVALVFLNSPATKPASEQATTA